jgi:hypothetical protein
MKFDSRITIALIVAVLIDTAGGLIWAGRAAARLDAVEQQLAIQQPVAERLARVEERLIEQRLQLDRIEQHIDLELRARR